MTVGWGTSSLSGHCEQEVISNICGHYEREEAILSLSEHCEREGVIASAIVYDRFSQEEAKSYQVEPGGEVDIASRMMMIGLCESLHWDCA